MGIYSEYLDRQFSFEQLGAERKRQLKRISDIRSRDVLVFAANLMNSKQPIAINYSDLLPFNDQLSNLDGTGAIDVILETPGGSGETVEDMVKLLRAKVQDGRCRRSGDSKERRYDHGDGCRRSLDGTGFITGPNRRSDVLAGQDFFGPCAA